MALEGTLKVTTTVNGKERTMIRDMTDYTTGDFLDLDIPAAKAGTVAVHTSVSVGTLTMATGHGIATGNRLDLHWTDTDGINRHRRGVVVGTVSVNSVPITGGTGDDLPAVAYVIAAMVPTAHNVSAMAMNDYSCWSAECNTTKGVVASFGAGSYTEQDSLMLNGDVYQGKAATWCDKLMGDNPLESATAVTRLYVSHGDITKSVNFSFDSGVAA